MISQDGPDPSGVSTLILPKRTLCRRRAWPVVLGLVCSLLFSSAGAATLSPSAAAGLVDDRALLRQDETPIFALPGTLRAAQGQPFSTYFIDRDGIFYALVGADAAVEGEIETLLAQNRGVKVWGTLYPAGRMSSQAEIVASAIQATDAAPEAGANPPPATSSATALVEIGRINVRTQPDVNAPPAGQLEPGTRCPIVERTVDTKWYRLTCENGVAGWVSYQLITVEGDLAGVPLAEAAAPAPTPIPPPPTFVNWKTAYYANRDLAGEPVALDDLPEVNFDWGSGSPHPAVPPDNFSLRMERTIDFPAGNYRFITRADDGVRVYINGEMSINNWQIGATQDTRADRYLSGPTRLMIEYFEAAGLAELHFGFGELRAEEWEADYFGNVDLGGNPAWITIEAGSAPFALDHDWGAGSPRPGVIGTDYWSAHWRGTFFLPAGTYDFSIRSDDGIRVFLDDQAIIVNWTDGYKEETRRIFGIGEGYHDLRVEFYERTGDARVRLLWQRTGAGGIQ